MTKKELRKDILEILAALAQADAYSENGNIQLCRAVETLEELATPQPDTVGTHCDTCLVALGHLAKGTLEGRTLACGTLMALVVSDVPDAAQRAHKTERVASSE